MQFGGGNFYTTKSKCFDLDSYRTKKAKREKKGKPWTGQTAVNKEDSLYNLYKWYGLQTPQKIFLKIPQKFHDKTVQFNILWLNVIKIDGIGILQSAHKQGHPSFHFHKPGSKRRYPCTQTALAVPKCFPVCSSFVLVIASDMHLEPESEKRAKNVDFHTAKNLQIQATLFRKFLDDFS